MENQELNQTSVLTDIVELNQKQGKSCKTCNSSEKLSTNNVVIIITALSTVFLTFYGLISMVKDIAEWFTR